MKALKVCWLSAGVSSFIAGCLVKDSVDEFIYIDVADQHPDSMRFVKDCEMVLEKPIKILISPYENVNNACLGAGIVRHAKNGYAPCTDYLKKRVRKEWEYSHKDYDITYVWGFDVEEKHRAERLIEAQPNFKHEFPLIDNQLTKQEVHGMCDSLGVRRPIMYDLGYNNNNCIGCVKGGMATGIKSVLTFLTFLKAVQSLKENLIAEF